ncbi:MAG: glycosyltransferase family 4 protein [Candidatus Omnitrophica bacterium]|nr:glycosyltransferase family 4 protein [Candidatus Omnitrophota bacterium]
MKIIFITREGYNLSGARVRCYNFARELNEYGIDTKVFSFGDNLGAKYGEKEFQMSLREKIRYNIKAFNSLFKEEKNTIFYMQRLNYHTLAAFSVSLLKKNKFIFDCDDWNIRENPIYYLGFLPSSKMEFLTRLIAKYADICIAASGYLKDHLSKFNKKVYYIPTGVDTEIFKPKDILRENNEKIKLCWIGTVYHKDVYVNLKFIIDSFIFLAERYKNIFLTLAGEGKYFERIKEEVKNRSWKERININSWIHPDKVPTYLDGIDIGLLPLIQTTKFNKSKSPTRLFEYMAMSKSTVSSNIGEAREIIQDGINGFLAKTKEEFIQKMERLIRDSTFRQEMGRNARKTIEEKYSLKVLGKQLHDILKTV